MSHAAEQPVTVSPIGIAIAMVMAAALAVLLSPSQKEQSLQPTFELERLIPIAFSDWKEEPLVTPLKVAPDVQAKLDKIYNQTLARTYINSKGERIMLSVAYGSNQSDGMQVHKPEVCYPAQGFLITSKGNATLDFMKDKIPVTRLVAQNKNRIEPITYWITVAGKTSTSRFEAKLAKLAYTITGRVPDGILVRVSNIGTSVEESYALHELFLKDLLGSVDEKNKTLLIGSGS